MHFTCAFHLCASDRIVHVPRMIDRCNNLPNNIFPLLAGILRSTAKFVTVWCKTKWNWSDFFIVIEKSFHFVVGSFVFSVSTLITSSIYGPLFAIGVFLLISHFVSRACFMSYLARSNRLFSNGPWLPLRQPDGGFHPSKLEKECESVELLTKDGLTLRGSFFHRNSSMNRGTVLFFHELNGNRWSVLPFLENLRKKGFNLFTFDQRGHGESESPTKTHPTPWITANDLEDSTAAVEYLKSREKKEELGVFGLGKGATLALCCASNDPQVQAVVLDSPAPEDRLYEKNCFTAFGKLAPHFATHHFLWFVALSIKTLFYLAAWPFFTLISAWRRFMFSLWCGGSFVNTWTIIKKLRKPVLILHSDLDSCVTLPQIHSFCRRLPVRPKVCLTKHLEGTEQDPLQFSADQIASFFQQTLSVNDSLRTVKFDKNTPTSSMDTPPVGGGLEVSSRHFTLPFFAAK